MFYNVSYMLSGNTKMCGVAANSESEAKAKATKSLPKGADVYHVEKAASEEKTRAYMKSKGMKIIDSNDATNIIEQKKGYILAVNREGTVVLAFPGEDPNSNPHMYLGKADKAENIEAGKRMLHKMADAATCDATYKVTYKYEGSIDRRFAYVKAANEEQAKQKCLKEHTDRMRNARIIDILKMHDSALRIDPLTGFLLKGANDAKDKRKTADYAFENSDVVKCAKYLWTWDDSLEVQRNIFDKCMRESGAKTREEAIQYAKSVYKKELDAFYSQLKREVEKKLKAGYDKGLREGMNA